MITDRKSKLDLLNDVPPHDLAAERALLSAVLLDPSRLDAVATTVSSADFYDEASGTLWEAVATLRDAGEPISDTTLLVPALRRLGVSDALWSLADIGRLFAAGVASNAAYYANRIRDLSILRRQACMAAETMRRIYEPAANPADIARYVDAQLAGIAERRMCGDRMIGDVSSQVLREIEDATPRAGVMTGIYSVDQFLGPMVNGEMDVLAARPGLGKTSLAMQIGEHNAVKGRSVLFVSLEMTESELTKRTLCSLARVNGRRLRNGSLTSDEKLRLIQASEMLQRLPIRIWAPPSATMGEIRSHARWRDKTDGIDFLIIDYIGLIRDDNPRADDRERVSNASRAIKELAKELNVPLLVLSQLNREAEHKRPTKANLAQSGSLEQDADIVMFLHRGEKNDGGVEFIVSKYRNGEEGMLPLTFLPTETRFIDHHEPQRDESFDTIAEAMVGRGWLERAPETAGCRNV